MKMSNLILSAGVVAASLLSSPLSAQQFYAGVGLGAAKASGVNSSGTSGGVGYTVSGGDATKTSWKLLAGYQFTPIWGLEGQYSDLGRRGATVNFGPPVNASGSTTGASASQWGLAGTATLPLANNFYVMGKLGASWNKMDNYSVTVLGRTASGGGTKSDLLAGVGVGYNFNKNVGLRFEYENFGKFPPMAGTTSGSIKGDNWALTLKYAF